jgi:hypothetical protein
MKNQVKNAIRHLVCKAYDAFANNKTDVSVLSLPGDVWEFENYVVNHNDSSTYFGKSYVLDMALFEYKDEVYQNNSMQLFNIANTHKNNTYLLSRCGIAYHHKYVHDSDVAKAKSNNIFAWFDFCGNPTTHNINLINTAKGKNVTYIFTFNTAWRQDKNVDPTVLQLGEYTNKAFAITAMFDKLAAELNLTKVWAFEYVSNHSPMIILCYSNDINVINDKTLNVGGNVKSIHKPKKVVVKGDYDIRIRRDLLPVHQDLQNNVDENTIIVKHNINRGTLAACKAWRTMWKRSNKIVPSV